MPQCWATITLYVRKNSHKLPRQPLEAILVALSTENRSHHDPLVPQKSMADDDGDWQARQRLRKTGPQLAMRPRPVVRILPAT
jgi:hypothetical protein